jgi:hypothetical protein
LLLTDQVSAGFVAITEIDPLPPGASTVKTLGLNEIVPDAGAAS